MSKQKSTSSTFITILAIAAVCFFALAAGLLLKSHFSEQPVEAADTSQLTQKPPEEPVDSTEAQIESEIPEVQDYSTAQTVNDIEFRIEGFHWEEKRVAVSLCFDLPDSSDWAIWKATLEEGNGEVHPLREVISSEIRKPPVDGMQKVWDFTAEGGTQVYTVEAAPDSKGYRCETLYFNDIDDFSPSIPFTLTIEALEAPPREGEDCTSAYLERIQSALDARGTGIRVKCVEEEYIGGLVIVEKPDSMSLETARAYLSSPEFYLDTHGIRGPWVFTFVIK